MAILYIYIQLCVESDPVLCCWIPGTKQQLGSPASRAQDKVLSSWNSHMLVLLPQNFIK